MPTSSVDLGADDRPQPAEAAIAVPGLGMALRAASQAGLTRSLRGQFDQMFDRSIRPDYFKKMAFDAPMGDPGWFGPGSAVWHVHSNLPVLTMGLLAGAHIEQLHPSIGWMGYDHSRVVQRENGKPTGAIDINGARIRYAHSIAFFQATAFGPTETAERAARAVRAMHHTVKGVRPDGVPYDADDPEFLRWNYATVVWGIAAAHERYHPNPLRGDAIDQYYQEFVRVGEALGGRDLPSTKAEVAAYLATELPVLGLTAPGVASLWPSIKNHVKPAERPVHKFLYWAKNDLMPPWAQKLFLFEPPMGPVVHARRAFLKALLQTVDATTGPMREFEQSMARVAGASTSKPNLDSVKALQSTIDAPMDRALVEQTV